MRWGDRYVTLMLVGLGMTLLMVIAIIVAATVPSLRVIAAGVVVGTILARVPLTFLRRRELKARMARLKAENGGALPIPNPRRARILIASFSGAFAALGIAALAMAILVSDVDRLVLIIFGAVFVIAGAAFALTGRRIFRERAAADRR